MGYYTRLKDGETLDFSQVKGSLDSIKGAYTFSRTAEFSHGEFGKSELLEEYINQRTFTIDLVFSDITGEDQQEALAFFSTGEKYLVNAPEFSIAEMKFYVISADADFFNSTDIVSLTCQAEYGINVQEEKVEIYSASILAGASSPTISLPYVNSDPYPVTVLVEIETASYNALWKPVINISLKENTLGGFIATSGAINQFGELQSWIGKKFSFNSFYEMQEGQGVISPLDAQFFKIPASRSGTLTIGSFLNPLTTPAPYTIKVFLTHTKELS